MPGGLEKWHGLSPFLAWCLLSSLLISPSLSFFIHCSPTFFALLSLFTHHLCRSNVLFSLFFACLYLSPDVIATLLPSPTSYPQTYPYFYFSDPYLHFVAVLRLLFSFCECVALTTPLALPVGLTLDQHDWAWPPWVLLASQSSAIRSVLRILNP